MNVIRIITETAGDHVHVMVRTGTEVTAGGGRMPLAGTLTFRRDEWDGLRRVLAAGLLVTDTVRIEIMEKDPAPTSG